MGRAARASGGTTGSGACLATGTDGTTPRGRPGPLRMGVSGSCLVGGKVATTIVFCHALVLVSPPLGPGVLPIVTSVERPVPGPPVSVARRGAPVASGRRPRPLVSITPRRNGPAPRRSEGRGPSGRRRGRPTPRRAVSAVPVPRPVPPVSVAARSSTGRSRGRGTPAGRASTRWQRRPVAARHVAI